MISNALGFIPQNLPSLNLDFTQGILNPALSFVRNSIGTYFDSNGILQTAAVNVPRFDYDPVTKQPLGLLIEEQRTNQVCYSNTLTSWSNSGSVATLLPGTSLGLSRYSIASNGQAWHRIQASAFTVNSGTSYSGFVLYENTGMSGRIRIVFRDGTSAKESLLYGTIGAMSIDSNAGTVTFTDVAISPTVRKCSFTYTPNFSGTFYLGLGADTTVSGATATFLAAQFETGLFVTSYIPTGSSAVTRSVDVCYTGLGNWYNFSQGSIYSSFIPLTNQNNRGVFSLNDNSASNRIDFRSAGANPFITVGGTGQVVAYPPVVITVGAVNKYAMSFSAGAFAITGNGGGIATASPTAIPTNLNTLQLGNIDGIGSPQILNGYLRKISYYPRRLSNSTLQALTL